MMSPFLERYRKQLVISAGLITLLGSFILASPQTFLGMRIYRSFMSTIPVTAILALGMTYLVIVGEMDLSFPAISATAAYVFSMIYTTTGSAALALAGGLLFGLFSGAVNGVIVVMIGVPSIIATIGTQFFWRGLVLLASDGLALSLASIRGTMIHQLFVGRLAGEIPAQALWCLGLAVILCLVLNRHSMGDALLFTGDNRKTAAMMGISVSRVRIGAFVLMGVLSAFAGILATLELANWWPTQGEGYMLLVFASVFIGGTSAYGGEGTIYGTMIGSVVIGIIEAGILSTGLAGFWTRLVYGLIIILSVSLYARMSRKTG
jgi:simple sugar transport system permease protein